MLTALYEFMSEPQKFVAVYRNGEIYIMPVGTGIEQNALDGASEPHLDLR